MFLSFSLRFTQENEFISKKKNVLNNFILILTTINLPDWRSIKMVTG